MTRRRNSKAHQEAKPQRAPEPAPKKQVKVKEREKTALMLKTHLEVILEQAKTYETYNEQVKVIQARMKQIRGPIEQEVQHHGIDNGMGHLHLQDVETGVDIEYQRKGGQPGPLNELAAQTILEQKGILDKCSHTYTVTEIDEAKILEAYQADLLSAEDIDLMFPKTKETWSLRIHLDQDKNPDYGKLQSYRKALEKGTVEVTDMPEVEVEDIKE